MEWTNALVFPTLWLHAMIAPDEVGQGHCVADALDKVSIKQGRKESQEETRCEGGADSIANAMTARKQKRHSPENCPCWAVRSFEGGGEGRPQSVPDLSNVRCIPAWGSPPSTFVGFFLDESWSNVLRGWHAVCIVVFAETTQSGVIFPFVS